MNVTLIRIGGGGYFLARVHMSRSAEADSFPFNIRFAVLTAMTMKSIRFYGL
jgi:hypothetical protein